ncbi:MAG: hypothetical protein HYV07_21385 [Deltaproteobacteria bacterium]|nr:hypothetical protein [Deltaproteobacteria bacterium]
MSILAAGAFACGGDEPPPPANAPVVRIDAGSSFEGKPTPEQEKALGAALHRAHLEAEKEPAACRDCHRIEGDERGPQTHRCLSCHEDQKSAVHARVSEEDAKECLSCHDFLATDANPWSCGRCHVQKHADPDARKAFSNAPLIPVHGDEACGACHQAHGDAPLLRSSCLECHEDSTTHHQKGKLRDPDQCLECHRGHEKASSIKAPPDRCAACHTREPARAASTSTAARGRRFASAVFTGHDVCLVCHKPHGLTRREPCAGCHEEKSVVVGATAKEHQLCESCHPPHEVRSGRSNPCVKCHDKIPTTTHPKDERLGECAGCHPIHPIAGALLPPRSCVSCHEPPKAGVIHGGAPCESCHKPHDFKLAPATSPEICAPCHVAGAAKSGSSKLVRAIKDHSVCQECHDKPAHAPLQFARPFAPAGSPRSTQLGPTCERCHAEELETAPKGHEKCLDCHRPHEGTSKKTCVECHEERGAGIHSKERGACEKCHRPHGPKGVESPLPCKKCHDAPLPFLHKAADHGECKDCHTFHGAPRAGRARCLGSCHAKQATHEPNAKACIACHPFGQAGAARR